MGKNIRAKDETKTREGIFSKLSKMAQSMKGDTMESKGWKTLAVVGVWASIAIMFVATGELSNDIVANGALATFLIALFL